jgi:uncharacterized membrane protein YagU involved in acid resistance
VAQDGPHERTPDLFDIITGAGAGVAATVAMSALMLIAQKLGYQGQQPPERIVEAGLDAADVERTERQENVLASVAHLGFGASAGIVYRVLRKVLRTPGPPIAHGAGYGLAVWSVNYQGWIPWAGILPPTRKDRSDRVATMILAHLVYGAVLGALAEPGRQRR